MRQVGEGPGGKQPRASRVEIREARTPAEVAAAGRVTAAAYEEFAPPPGTHAPDWDAYAATLHDARTRAEEGLLLVAVEDGEVVGTVTLYLHPAPTSDHWRPGDATVRYLAVAPAARGRGIGRALLEACLRRAREAGKRRIALHTTEAMATARAMYERAGFVREPEGDIKLERLTILAYARAL